MKKVLLSVLVAGCATIASAQRSIDLATTTINFDTIFGATTGTSASPKFTVKNLGPDTLVKGDTIVYQFWVANSSGNVEAATPPSPSNYWPLPLSVDTLLPGDSVLVSDPTVRTLNKYVTVSSNNFIFIITAHAVRRDNNAALALTFETSPKNANNTTAKVGIWMNEQLWPVGLNEEIEGAKFSVYPNPASSVVNFTTEYTKATKVEIMDMAGRLVERADFNLGSSQVDVSSYNKGIYFYNVISTEGKVVKAGKFTVN